MPWPPAKFLRLKCLLKYLLREYQAYPDKIRRQFLKSILEITEEAIEKFNFFPPDAKLQSEVPMPEWVSVFNANTGRRDRTIGMDEFIGKLKSVWSVDEWINKGSPIARKKKRKESQD